MLQSSYNLAYFPKQQISDGKKDKTWYKECIDSAISLAFMDEGGSKRKMQIYSDLDNDIINEEEIEEVFNPMQIEYAAFPASLKNYPLSVPKIDLLVGEELKRRYDWVIRSRNETAYSTAQSDLQDMLMDILIDELTATSYDEQHAQQRIQDFSKYAKWQYKDVHELTATRILQYLWREQDVQDKFNRGFRHALVEGQEIYRIDDIGGEPSIIKADPKNVYTIRRGSSEKIEDADIIIEINYEPIGAVIDEFYDDLTSKDITEIEGARKNSSAVGGSVLNYTSMYPPIYSNLDPGPNGEGFLPINQLENIYNVFGLPYDAKGNVRVVRCRWVGRRKVGRLTYFDEEGNEQERIVSDKYKINTDNGEMIKWIWINEAYEGNLIGQDIYTKTRPREIQMRHFDNISKCFLGYVGTDYGKSLMSRMEPYQYLYNVYMRRLELTLAKYKGPIYELDMSKVPDGWELDKWMYYAEVLGWAPVDPFNEGKRGSSTGKLAGNFNTTGKVLDPNIGNYIQQLIMMLQYIETQMGKIAGVTEQRQGQVDNRETVGGVERAVTQSSHITEKWFFIHDETKRRALHALLDTAKYIWKKKQSKKLNFVLDDMSRVFLEFNPSELATTEFDLFVSNSRDDYEIRQVLKELSHAAAQNGMGLGVVANVLRMDSVTEMARALDQAEEEAFRRQEESNKANSELERQRLQIDLEEKEKDRELEYYKVDLDAQIEREKIAASNSNIETNNRDDDTHLKTQKQALDERKHSDDISLRERDLNEKIRSNKAKEIIVKNKSSSATNKK